MDIIKEYFTPVHQLRAYLNQCIVGQEALITRLLVALLADGHLLVEGAPGLAKTTTIKTLAHCLEGSFHRIQFTPDLLPADIIGTDIYRHEQGTFTFQQGPIFHNIILADEINRAPAKVQSALLEAMAERQITVGHSTYSLPQLFFVMATQNPLEQSGTYALPEAQLDRFLLYTRLPYPTEDAEAKILKLARAQALENYTRPSKPPHTLSQASIFAIRKHLLSLHMSAPLENYLLQLVLATREPHRYSDDLVRFIKIGASPRATIGLDRAARAHAWLSERDYVTPEDIQLLAPDILRHRILLSFEAEAEQFTTDMVIAELLKRIPIP